MSSVLPSDSRLRVFIGHKQKHAGEYVGRPFVLGNPASHRSGTLAAHKVPTIAVALREYKRVFAEWCADEASPENIKPDRLAQKLASKGVITLTCWCFEDRVEYANALALRCHSQIVAAEVLRRAEIIRGSSHV